MAPGPRNRTNAHTRRELQREIQKRQSSTKNSSQKNYETEQPQNILEAWTPGSYTALKALLSARLCSAIWGLINDCDETYNYWEPTHYLLYGKGFQTWEYSPEYALRSYTYLLLHAVPAWIYSRLLQSNRMLVFFFLRCLLALVSSVCELYFYRGVCKEFGAAVGRLTLGIMVFSAGMFISSTAFLPSSFAMYMAMLSIGAWYQQCSELAIFTTAISTFLGWPFAGALGVPIAFDILFRRHQFKMFIKWCLISTFTILMPMVQIDTNYFGRLVVAPLNIISYNVLSSHGPDLYGVEPPTFYLMNGFLNFNFVFLACLVTLPVHHILSVVADLPKKNDIYLPMWLSLSPLYLWLAIFWPQPHKEERFLFPIYPMICLAAAATVDFCQKLIFAVFIKEKKQHYLHHTNIFALVFLIVTSLLSLSRTIGQYKAYHAPFETFLELNRIALEEDFALSDANINVCAGREWHRFPSSFFLPSLNWNYNFIESEFKGQLPKQYLDLANATSILPTHMNNLNIEEPTRYVPISSCHFLIDIDREEETPKEPRYSLQKDKWNVIYTVPFLDPINSHKFFRAFYVPYLTEQYCSYVNYALFQSTKWKPKGRHRNMFNR